jgi:hypothetical protein
VPEPLYKKGAKAAVTGSDWHITKSGHRVLLTELPLAAVHHTTPKPKPYLKWRLDRFLDNEHGNELKEVYQAAIHTEWNNTTAGTDVSSMQPEALVKLVAKVITSAAERVVGRKRIVPGRTKSWWNSHIQAAVDRRRDLHAAYQQQQENTEAARRYEAQKEHVQQMINNAKDLQQANTALQVNRDFRETLDDHSPLGKKRLWNSIAATPRYKGKLPFQPPAAVIDPATDQRKVGVTGVLLAQANHTSLLGDQQRFSSSNPQFDDEWCTHVTNAVQNYRQLAHLDAYAGPTQTDHLDAPITGEEILKAMSSLKNGKAPSPTTTIPNELLKYGGNSMATMLEEVFNAIWRAGCPPQDWLYGVVQYFHKSGATDDMSNYRGITLLDVVSKLFHKVLANRLLEYAEDNNLLHTAQNAFRKKRCTDDHLYCISQVARGRQRMQHATYAFFLDLRKAYDTVWRDGLLYKLWQAGVRGRLWHYIDSLYRTSRRAVRVGGHISEVIEIDLGVAQGDTLSCILFNIFANDLIETYQQACAGVPLPSQQDQQATSNEPKRLACQLFADDFMGIAETPSELQHGITVARDWCNKWRMQANIGPAKTAVMVFAPEHAPPLHEGVLLWGTEPLPVVKRYKYLGVMLSSDCSWDAHVEYLCDKTRKVAYALGSVLHNRRMSAGARRLVLLAVLRPVVEHGSPVWVPTPADMQRLEQVQVRVLRRIVSLNSHVPDDVLRMELGCRPYASWMDQRKLEYAFRLQRMSDDRLPRHVSEAAWPAVGGQCHERMHAGVVSAIEAKTKVDVHAAAESKISYAAFKCSAALAVRAHDMKCVTRLHRSTVGRYVRIIGDPEHFPNQLQGYMLGPVTAAQKALLLCRADMLPTAQRMHRQKKAESPACQCCRTGVAETLEHVVLLCPAHDSLRKDMWDGLVDSVGGAVVAAVKAKPTAECLEAILGSHDWNGSRTAVQEVVGKYLARLLAGRSTMLGLGVKATGRDKEVAPPAGPQRDMPTAAASPAAERDTACQCCQLKSSRRHNQMLLCDGCQRGYHQHCLQKPLAKVPKGDWLCPGCEAQAASGAQKRTPTNSECPPATGQACVVCCDPGDAGKMLLCDSCDCGYHWYCLGENHRRVPRGTWHCPGCRPGGTLPAHRGARAHGACATAGAQ